VPEGLMVGGKSAYGEDPPSKCLAYRAGSVVTTMHFRDGKSQMLLFLWHLP
jgi:hypothetical protein